VGGGSGAERASGLHRRLRRGRGVGVVEGTNEEEAAAPMGIQCQLEMAIFDSAHGDPLARRVSDLVTLGWR
jgi:hypothetical protein